MFSKGGSQLQKLMGPLMNRVRHPSPLKTKRLSDRKASLGLDDKMQRPYNSIQFERNLNIEFLWKYFLFGPSGSFPLQFSYCEYIYPNIRKADSEALTKLYILKIISKVR